MADGSRSLFTINDAIMTSLLVLKVTNVSTNFLILSDTL